MGTNNDGRRNAQGLQDQAGSEEQRGPRTSQQGQGPGGAAGVQQEQAGVAGAQAGQGGNGPGGTWQQSTHPAQQGGLGQSGGVVGTTGNKRDRGERR